MQLNLNFLSSRRNSKIILEIILGMRMNRDFFYQMPPTQTISPAPIPGRKKKKERISCLACANAGGSERMPLLVLGKSICPRCSNEKTRSSLKISYKSSPTAWLSYSIFSTWLGEFDELVSTTRGRKI